VIPELPEPSEAEARALGAALPGLAAGLHDSEFTLLELADRLLDRGVVLVGEATISVAGVDLVYLGLNVVLTAVENLLPKDENAPPSSRAERGIRRDGDTEGPSAPQGGSDSSLRSE
jgi:hypothetical protein